MKGCRKLVKADEINADITKSLKSSDGVKRAKEPKARVVKTTERVVTKVKAPRAKRVQNLWKNFQGVLFLFTKTTLVSSERKKMSSKPYISKCIDLERCRCFDFARFLYDCPTQLSRGKCKKSNNFVATFFFPQFLVDVMSDSYFAQFVIVDRRNMYP